MMTSSWKQELRRNFTRIDSLLDFLEIPKAFHHVFLSHSHFSLNVPYRLASKIEKNNLQDPLLLQFLPLKKESIKTKGFTCDPVGDVSAQVAPKLLHKYAGRVLLVCTPACAMHCRYCFRQEFNYTKPTLGFEEEIAYIKNDTSIREVILSGGDPLSLSETLLEGLLEKISVIPHVKVIRFHTRFPIGIPERIDTRFLSYLKGLPQQIYVVLHINHKRELDQDIWDKITLLQQERVVVLNQTVLLKGVNDSSDVLKDLFEVLAENGVIPYYLHQLDRIQGAAHFEVSEATGKHIMEELMRKLPGYAVPKYVKEVSSHLSKTLC